MPESDEARSAISDDVSPYLCLRDTPSARAVGSWSAAPPRLSWGPTLLRPVLSRIGTGWDSASSPLTGPALGADYYLTSRRSVMHREDKDTCVFLLLVQQCRTGGHICIAYRVSSRRCTCCSLRNSFVTPSITCTWPFEQGFEPNSDCILRSETPSITCTWPAPTGLLISLPLPRLRVLGLRVRADLFGNLALRARLRAWRPFHSRARRRHLLALGRRPVTHARARGLEGALA